MRIVVNYNSSTPVSCNSNITGETEDYTLTVISPIAYYSNSTGNLDVLTTWGTNTDGSGTAPSSFTTGGQTFNIVNNTTPTIGAPWTVSGTGSKVVVGDGTNPVNFTIPASYAYSGTVDVSGASSLTIANTTIPTLGTLAATSTVDYASAGSQPLTAANYGNLTNSGNGTRVLPSTGTVGIAGTYTPTTGTRTITGSTINFNGTGSQSIPAIAYNNLNISGTRASATVTLVTGTIAVGGTFSPTATGVNYNNTGNTFDFSSGSAQTIPAFNYNNLTIQGMVQGLLPHPELSELPGRTHQPLGPEPLQVVLLTTTVPLPKRWLQPPTTI